MAHEQQRDFCRKVKARFPEFFHGKLVVDFGSLDINGSNQYLFENSGYIGVDLFAGRNVDLACKGHELGLPDESVDVIISTECFEHDSHYGKTINNINRLLKRGGLFLFSCATTGRAEHGTRRTTPEDAPFTQLLGDWADYYKNLEESHIRDVIDIDAVFDEYEFSHQNETHDLYFWGIKKGELTERTDYSFLVETGIYGKLRTDLTHAFGEIEASKAEALSLKKTLRVAEDRALGLAEELQRAKSAIGQSESEALSLKDTLRIAEDKFVGVSRERDQLTDNLQFIKNELIRVEKYLRESEIRDNESQILYYKVLNSLSWKITKPLRFFGRIIRLEFGEAFSFVRRTNFYASIKVIYFRLNRACGYLAKGNIVGLLERVRHYRKEIRNKARQEKLADSLSLKVCVVTPRHTNFLAKLIADRLFFHGVNSKVTNQMPAEFNDDLYVVLSPQIFKHLPPGEKRIVYQLEQSVSSRWFDKKYFDILENSLGVLDYSLVNIDYLSSKGIAYPHVTYLPVGASNDYSKNILSSELETEILFYGDSFSSPRRQKMLAALSEHYNIEVINDLFGDEMISRLKSAKIIINLHYYENALLEMPRIQECLSLGIPVVSESSQDQYDYPELDGAVTFFEEGSISGMIRAVRTALDDKHIDIKKSVLHSSIKFEFMFDRFLVSMGLLPSSYIKKLTLPLQIGPNMFGLSMPETIARRKLFLEIKPKGCVVFDGIRRKPGWVGCGLSYAALARHAKANNMTTMTVMEDDVILPTDFDLKLESINRFLSAKPGGWDVFSGVIAALNPDAEIIAVEDFEGQKFVTINKMTSTVFNIYSGLAIEMFSNWDPENLDAEKNTIDRYLENQKSIKVITTLPFLVGHREEVHSTLWGFQNTTYVKMIAISQTLLEAKVAEFLAKQ